VKIFKIKDMHMGWFAGNFEPTAYKTEKFEACHRIHLKGEVWDRHTHKIGTEINLLVKGKMKMCGSILETGDIFIVMPGEISDPEFLEDCEIVCIKTPSIPGDKYAV
tara:strand:+ start:1045 stop:1365 length:321 start_codon:yes stop_codon:yes gene_type:complete